MNRRSVLRWLGLAPVAAPAAVAAAGVQAMPRQRHSARIELLPDGRSRFVIDVQSIVIRPAPLDAGSWMNAREAFLDDGRHVMIGRDGSAWEARRPV
ncbi:hypothetical protein ACQKJ1_05435 [Methylorubrum rhodesianum]|uniref:hypothetical protein n=1 Tax=Methylorubrum rhodesianum TaxID=29427 RepID=UPI003D07B80D